MYTGNGELHHCMAFLPVCCCLAGLHACKKPAKHPVMPAAWRFIGFAWYLLSKLCAFLIMPWTKTKAFQGL